MEFPPRRIELPSTCAGSLYVMPRPSPDHLDAEVAELRGMGINNIVSLLADDEVAKLGLSHEAEACAARGITFRNHPIADFGVPERDAFQELAETIKGWLDDGHQVVIHCRAGVGRSGTLACCVLQLFGIEADVAMTTVGAARGTRVPETEQQRQFVRAFQSPDD